MPVAPSVAALMGLVRNRVRAVARVPALAAERGYGVLVAEQHRGVPVECWAVGIRAGAVLPRSL